MIIIWGCTVETVLQGRHDSSREGTVLEKDPVYSGERCGQNGPESPILQGGGESQYRGSTVSEPVQFSHAINDKSNVVNILYNRIK